MKLTLSALFFSKTKALSSLDSTKLLFLACISNNSLLEMKVKIDVIDFQRLQTFEENRALWSRQLQQQQNMAINTNALSYLIIEMSSGLTKCCQCCWCSVAACNVACCIDNWHSVEACGLAYLWCDACCWTLCAPLCISQECGDSKKAMENCTKGCKYCIFSCALSCVGVCDGCYNCIQIIKVACDSGIKGYSQLLKNAEFIANKVKESLGLTTGSEPIASMGNISP